MKVSVLSDTHSFIDQQLLDHLKDSDEIWHAGDIGNIEVLEALEQLTGKIRAVYGNIDGKDIRVSIPEHNFFELDGKKILITHIANKPPKYNAQVRALLAEHHPDLLICGHSHILRVENDGHNGLLFINPGACGHHGFHKVRTIIQFELINGKPANMKVIELGKRGKMKA